MMWDYCKDYWVKFHASFHDSEVIIWARLNAVMVPVIMGLHNVDWSAYITDKHLLIGYVAVNSVMTEYLRRRRADFSEPKEDPEPKE